MPIYYHARKTIRQVPTMKFTSLRTTVSLATLIATLTACGGGGDADAGSPTPFSAVPSSLAVTAVGVAAGGVTPTGQCAPGFAGRIFIYGGVAPYRIDNTTPSVVVLDKTEVSDRGGSFDVSFTANCTLSQGVLLVIVDKLDHQITVTLNNNAAS